MTKPTKRELDAHVNKVLALFYKMFKAHPVGSRKHIQMLNLIRALSAILVDKER
jgi:hypothetical protein